MTTQANILPDTTVSQEILAMSEGKPDIDITAIKTRIKQASADIPAADREQQTLAARLAGYAAEYVSATLTGYFHVTRTPAIKRIDTNGTVTETTEEVVKRTFVPPRPDLSVKDVSKFIRDAMDVQADSVLESTKEAKVKGANARSKTVDIILPIAARAAMLVATGSDGACLAFFIGNRHVELDGEGKPPRGAVLAVAGQSNALFPHFAGPKVGGETSLLVNPSTGLVRMASEQIRTSFAHHFEGKARDAFGKIARGTREQSHNTSDTEKAIAAIPEKAEALPALVSKLLPIFRKALLDPTGKSVKELAGCQDYLEEFAGVLDKLFDKVCDYNDTHDKAEAA
jgi:hypothetical protein